MMITRAKTTLVTTIKRAALAPLLLIVAVGVASAQGGGNTVVPAPGGAPAMSPPLSLANLSEMERRIAALDREVVEGRKELEGIAPRRATIGGRARVRGRILYKMLRAGLMPLAGGFGSIVDHAQRVERLKRAVKLDLTEEMRLAARAGALAGALEAWTKERAELVEKKGILEAAKVALDEERGRREAFERAFGTSGYTPGGAARGEGEIVVYGANGRAHLESPDPGSFRARRGRLTFPVAGQAEVKPTSREGGPAIEIRASLGAVVKAVHGGRVAFADRYGTYGLLVILDHGDRYYTVSGNLRTIDVKVGDELSAGERIGTVGDDGRGPSLYFEVRQGNDKVPPATWLGL